MLTNDVTNNTLYLEGTVSEGIFSEKVLAYKRWT